MTRLALLLIAALTLAGTAWAQPAGPAPASTHSGTPAAAASQIEITADEWQELRAARSAAIKANPDLVAENTQLMEKIRALEAKLNAAMVKTDPSIVSILGKFEAQRQRSAAPAAPPPATPPPAK
jgi:hypothetical protein